MTSSVPAAPPARAYRRLGVEERRTQLLGAALTLFAHRAPDDVSIDEVAVAAGVSRPLVYRYFPGGRQQLYEAALGSAAEQLTRCFAEPPVGLPTERVGRVLDRYLGFVDQHDAGFSALLRGGSVAETSRTTTIVDGVRRAAADQILLHLGRSGRQGQEPAGPRLSMMVRTWIASVEAASLIWLDEDKRPAASNLRDWLVDHLMALLAVTAASDEETETVVADLLSQETAEGPAGRLATRIIPVVGRAAHLLPPD
ncbi:TetR/AcrR family transcriptional regulator [Streptomyces sp. NBC_01012]|uniref:TetR/AcrR family transcriptional regulator n=1 Tax=Streptomyces sp. NBC_01012 TaxID=2903717 RepID=UPI00386C16EA|nr:TetR/AcrR family transcriptional regulator [Streptomyces sp. NBC_01012]